MMKPAINTITVDRGRANHGDRNDFFLDDMESPVCVKTQSKVDYSSIAHGCLHARGSLFAGEGHDCPPRTPLSQPWVRDVGVGRAAGISKEK